MEVLRSAGLSSIEFTIPSSIPNESFTCLITDSLSASSFQVNATSDSNGAIGITLPAYYKKYDGEFEIVATVDGEELVSWSVSLLRPYCEPATAAAKLGITLDSATEYERVARFIIDSKTTGFKRCRKTITAVGLGLDYLPIHDRISKVYSLKENGEDLEVGSYTISNDQTSIVMSEEDNRLEYKTVWSTRYYAQSFPDNFDYEIDGDFGWQTIPGAIQEACLLLIQDISCGNNKYLSKYITEYKTDGYSIVYSPMAFATTGNNVVDKLLSRYQNTIRLRVL